VDWGWFWFFTKPIFKGLLLIYGVVGNYGFAILILTLLIKAIFFPLANKSYVAMSKMKKLQPLMEDIKSKYGSDPMKQQQELVALYKKEKVNPRHITRNMYSRIHIPRVTPRKKRYILKDCKA